MLNTGSFIRYIIILFVDVIIIVNVVYAFNLQGILPTVYAGGAGQGDLTGYYFGVDSLITSFTDYFERNNPFTHEYKIFIQNYYSFLSKVSFQGLANMALPNMQGNFREYITAILSIINLFFNIAYQFFAIIYGLCLLVYAISIVFTFVVFIVSIASGAYATPLPNTYGLHTCMMTMIAQLPF